MRNKKTSKVALEGMFVALAFLLAFLESLLPISLGIPGVKLGLANLVVMVTLFIIGPLEAFGISMVRIILAGFTFGSMASLIYAMAGGLVSYIIMVLAYHSKLFSVKGVSILGGVFHNIGQILIAMVVVSDSRLLFYLPVLILAGTITGYLIGLLADLMIKNVQRVMK